MNLGLCIAFRFRTPLEFFPCRGCDVIPAIGKLQQLTSLSLDMKARAIQDAGCIALAEALAQLRQLQSVTLNLRSNEIGDEGCRGLAEVLRHAPRLTTMNLHLDNNQINNTGCLVWAVNLREMQQLTSMRVSFRGNPEISGEAWAVWLEAVGNLRRLRNVTLVSLRRRTIEASPKALKGVVGHLRELYLASASRHHKAGASVCSTLAGALSQLQQLRSLGLDVADNFVDDLGCTALADALGKLQWLTTISLDMSCNCIRDAGFSALSLALRRLRQLKHVTLNLRSNCMGDFVAVRTYVFYNHVGIVDSLNTTKGYPLLRQPMGELYIMSIPKSLSIFGHGC